jgi:hypothetical protein
MAPHATYSAADDKKASDVAQALAKYGVDVSSVGVGGNDSPVSRSSQSPLTLIDTS